MITSGNGQGQSSTPAANSDESEQSLGCMGQVRRSWTALSYIFTDSASILRYTRNHPKFQQFRRPFLLLLLLRILLLVSVLLIELGISYPLNWLASALAEQNKETFWFYLEMFGVIAIIAAPVFALENYVDNLCYLKLRQSVTKVLLNLYHSDNTFYHVQRDQKLDNPGQRLCNDVDNWSYGVLSFGLIILQNCLRLVGWAIVLYSIGATMVMWLFIAAAVTVFLGVTFFASNLTHYTYLISKDEANFRAGVVRTRDNAETIAMYNAHRYEENWTYYRMLLALKDAKSLYQWKAGLCFVSASMKYIGTLLPIAILAYPYFNGEIRFGVIFQSSVSFRELLLALTIIVNKMTKLAWIQAGARRTNQVIIAAKQSQEGLKSPTTVRRVAGRSIAGTSKTFMRPLQPHAISTRSEPALVPTDTYGGIRFHFRSTAHLALITEQLHESRRLLQDTTEEKLDETTGEAIPPSVHGAGGAGQEYLPFLHAKNVSILIPGTNRLLLRGLNWCVFPRDNVLIVGPSGAGKSSLMRVISGLWRWGHGDVQRLLPNEMMFLPQKPYLPILPPEMNTLKQQLLFPSFMNVVNISENDYRTKPSTGAPPEDEIKTDPNTMTFSVRNEFNAPPRGAESMAEDEDALLDVLRQVNLEYVLREQTNADASTDWSKLLSLGEQQRLAFGRTLVQKPAMVFLDEATSALDVQNEQRMYRLLKEAGVTYISIGHRKTLTEFHDTILELKGDGAWEVKMRDDHIASLG